ncbi:MAG: PQQ-dependent sugar dehydrogenase [Bacteroidota bacterium]
MTVKTKKLLKYVMIFALLITVYLFINNWHIIPQPFITYGGKGNVTSDTSITAKQYAQYCGGCHGAQMNTFVNHEWKFGKTRASLFKGIKYGYPNDGMPAFDTTFTDKEIYDLTDYMLSGITAQKNNKKEKKGNGIFNTQLLTIKIDTIASVPDVPWCIAFLPSNELLVTERDGKLYRISADRKKQEINGVPSVKAEGQGGLLDVLPHPDFANNKIIYLSYSKAEDGYSGKSTTAIMKAILDGNTLKQQQDIFVALPYSSTRHHYAGKMVFDKNGYLFFSVGERGNEKKNPQSLENDLGKIHRIKDDGSIPADNPFVSNNKAKPSIYCYGNRNPQGLAVHPQTGEVWENEHGPMGGDEINLIVAGKNYGWPVVTYGINYNGTAITDKTAMPGMEQPLHFWVPSIAPSGLAFVQGNKYKGWEGDVLSGSLKFRWLSRCKTNGNVITSEESMMKEVGRLRDVKMGPDGYIYITVESPGLVLRLLPVE